MDNKNTDKVQTNEAKKEKFILTGAAVFMLTALTVTGLYINNSHSGKNQLLEQDLGLDGELSGELLQSPELQEGDLQSVDSGTVENPGRTGVADNGNGKKSASKTSNTLTAEEHAETEEALTEEAMSEMIENMMLSFDVMQMLWPVPLENEVIIPYSMDKPVYFKTLDQYKYNPATVIAAEEGTPVCAVSAGKITKRYWDYETGWTYEMDLGGGFKAYYGQLDNMQKDENTYVAAGDVLGYVAAPTKYYAEEGSNLYFAMTQDDRAVCPTDYMGE